MHDDLCDFISFDFVAAGQTVGTDQYEHVQHPLLLVNGTDRYHTLVSVLAAVQHLSHCYLLVSKGVDTRAVLAVWLRRTVRTSCSRTHNTAKTDGLKQGEGRSQPYRYSRVTVPFA